MSERYTTARIPSARSLGAPSVMEGLYLGAELATRSARPGAYDAMKIPSLVNGRQQMPDTPPPAPVEYIPPAPAPRVTARAPVAISDAEHAIVQPAPIPTSTPRRKTSQNPYGEDSPAGDPHIATSRELQDALNELRLREAESRAWQAYVDLLQLRARMSRVARALPFPPLTEPPRLTGAA